MRIYIDSDFKCHTSNDGTMREVETSAFDGKCPEYIEGYRFVPAGETWVRSDGAVFHGEMVSPWKPYADIAAIQNAVDRNSAEWEEKMVEAEFVTDDDGNRYHREVGTDGEYHLVLIESYTGELFQ